MRNTYPQVLSAQVPTTWVCKVTAEPPTDLGSGCVASRTVCCAAGEPHMMLAGDASILHAKPFINVFLFKHTACRLYVSVVTVCMTLCRAGCCLQQGRACFAVT